MKKTKLFLIAGIIALTGVSSKAQFSSGGAGASPMTALNSGDISSLDNVKNVNIIFDYTELGVGAFRKEEDYINKKCEDLEKKGKGDCEKFKEDWTSARKRRYEPKFEDLFNKVGQKEIDMIGKNYASDAPYTLLVHTIFIEPGVNAGIYKKPAFIDVEMTFKDKSGKELCKFFVKNAVGAQLMGMDYDVSSRLVESYAKAAKMLVLGIKKERKKKK